MNDYSSKISELPEGGRVRSNTQLPVSNETASGMQTERTSLLDIRKELNYENAYETLPLGVADTIRDETFYVYTSSQKLSVFEYLNTGNGSAQVIDDTGTPVTHLTELGRAGIPVIASMEQLKVRVPRGTGEIVKLTEYYPGKINGGGEFVSVANKTAIDDGGYTTIRINADYCWYRKDLRDLTLWDGGCDNSIPDNGPMLEKIHFSRSLQPIRVPSQYFGIITPVNWLPNKAISLYSDATYTGRSVFVYNGKDINDEATGVFNIIAPDGQFTYSGIRFEGFSILGQNHIIHGISLRNAGYVHVDRVKVENFRGAGLYIDQVQDSYFNSFEVQICGRTSGDYTVYADKVNLTKTTHAPIHIISTKQGDNSNMIRFRDCQWEANNVSPTVYYRGGIGLWIEKIHAEQRTGLLAPNNGFDPDFVPDRTSEAAGRVFLWVDGTSSSEVMLDSCQCSQFDKFVHAGGYGNVTISNTTRGGGLNINSNNRTFIVAVINSWLSTVYFGGSVKAYLTNCQFRDFTWTYPSFPGLISNCTFTDVKIANDGSNPDIHFNNCIFDSFNNNTKNVRVMGGRCIGDFTFRAPQGGGSVIGTILDGTVDVQASYGINFLPAGAFYSEIKGSTAPVETTQGTRPRGSIWWNRNVSGNTEGQVVGYIKDSSDKWVPFAYTGSLANGMITKEYTFATLPPAASSKRIIVTCTNTAKTPKDQLVYSDGTSWRYVADPATAVTAG